MQMIHGLTQNCKTLREVSIIKRKGQQSVLFYTLESGYCLFFFFFFFSSSSPNFCVIGAFSLQACGTRQAAMAEISAAAFVTVLTLRFWRAVDFSCTECTCWFRAHHCQFCPEFIGMGTGRREGWLCTPSLLSSPSQEKKIIYIYIL